jgi:hypothetical protein
MSKKDDEVKTGAITEDELEGLSEEERAAILGDDDTDALEEIAGESDDDDGEDGEGEDGDDGEGNADAAAAAGDEAAIEAAPASSAAAASAAASATPDADLVPEPDDTVIPFLPVKDVSTERERITALSAERKSLREKYANADITIEELLEKSDALNDETAELKAIIKQSEAAAHANEEAGKNSWQRAQDNFFTSHAEYRDNPVLWGALNQQVIMLGNDQKCAKWTGNQIMAEAHKQVSRHMRVADAPTKTQDDKPKVRKPAKPDLKVVPKTLAQVPAAAGDDPGQGDEFAPLDKLDGMELETALAKLSPEQERRYLQGR